MDTVLYSLSFIGILLITLVVHETGHLVVARMYGVKVNAFQIGIGWRIKTIYTGHTKIRMNQETRILNPDAPALSPGDITSVYVSRDEQDDRDDSYTALGILPRNNGRRGLAEEHWHDVRRHNLDHAQLTGRVRRIDEGEMVLADMGWSLRTIPLMAGVIFPEDPQRAMRNVYNTIRWYQQILITFAGPVTNLILVLAILMVLAVSPITAENVPIITVSHVEPGTPAEAAGVRENDRIIRMGKFTNPAPGEIVQSVNTAIERGKPVEIRIVRGRENLKIKVEPDLATGRIGIGISRKTPQGRAHSMAPGAVAQRFKSITQAYINSFATLASSIRNNPESTEVLSGPIMGAYETALAIEYAGPKAWLIILALFNLGVAFLNLLPIPPLDGFRIITEAVQAIRHGKPINPRLEHSLTMGGLFAIWFTGIYLIIRDVFNLIE